MTKPTTFAHRQIRYRLARSESTELVVRAGSDGSYLVEIHNRQDKMFEVQRVIIKLTALAEDIVCDPQPTILDRLLKIGVLDYSKNERIAVARAPRDAAPVAGLALRQIADSTFEWIPTEVIQLVRGEGLQFEVVAREQFVIAYRGERRKIDAIRVEITIEGDTCVLGEAETPVVS